MRNDLQETRAGDRAASGSLRPGVLLALLAILATLPYLNSLRNGFVYDDDTQVLANPYIKDFHHLREIFTTSVWSYLGDYRSSSNYYRPVMTLGYLVSNAIFGLRPLGFHLVSLILNTAVVCVLFLISRRFFGRIEIAAFGAALFALHPIHTEAVDWIAAVTELELALFFLLTFWLFLELGVQKGWKAGLLLLAMAGSYIAALLSKEQALTLPLVATIYEHLYRDDREVTSWARKVWRYGLLWVLVLAYLVTRIGLLGTFAPDVGRHRLDTGELLLSALGLIGQYLWKLVWPAHLCAFYVFPEELSSMLPWSLGGFIALAICGGLFLLLWKTERAASFGWVWLLVTLVPVLNARWMPANVFTERYLYLPSVGFVWVVAGAGALAWRKLGARSRPWRYAFLTGAFLIGTLGSWRIVTRNPVWRDDVTLFVDTLRLSPDAYFIHNNLGTVFWRQGKVAAAEQEWRRAEELAPQNELILNNLGMVAYRWQHYEEAASYFLRALASKSNYSDAHLHLGETYEKLGLMREAEVQFSTAVALAPGNFLMRNALGNLYFDQKRYLEAEDQYARSVQSQPNYWGYWGLGFIRWVKGDRLEAVRFFKNAESLDPPNTRTHALLGSLYLELGRTSDAAQELQTALRLDPNNTEARATLKKLDSQSPDGKP